MSRSAPKKPKKTGVKERAQRSRVERKTGAESDLSQTGDVIRVMAVDQFDVEMFGGDDDEQVTATVREIIADVRDHGDAALRRWTAKLDGVRLANFRLPAATMRVDRTLVADMKFAYARILRCHRAFADHGKTVSDGNGGTWARAVRPLARVGVYVPGGTASLFSTLLMAAAAARAAGVKEIVVATPPPVAMTIRAAARVAGITEIYAVGGAQAIAALAYGTESIKPVEKLVGPGNRWVAEAKRQVFGRVGIDSVAGPSEILILADESANPDILAADLLAQAEHDVRARPMLATTSRRLAAAVRAALPARLAELPRRAIAARALKERGAIIVCRNNASLLAFANRVAAEHLELQVRDPWAWAARIRAAGSIFVGADSSEVLGDYVAGPNHILPTGGTARFSPPLSARDFVAVSSLQSFTAPAAARLAPVAARLARAEGLEAHARSIEARRYGAMAKRTPSPQATSRRVRR